MGGPVLLTLRGDITKADATLWHWRWIFQPHALIAIRHWVIVRTGVSKISMDEDSMRNPLRDLPYIRCFLCVLSSQCHIRGDVHSYAAKSTLEPFIACPIARRR